MEFGQHHPVADIPTCIQRLYDKSKVVFGMNLGCKWGCTSINPLVNVKLKEGFLMLHISARPADQMVLQ